MNIRFEIDISNLRGLEADQINDFESALVQDIEILFHDWDIECDEIEVGTNLRESMWEHDIEDKGDVLLKARSEDGCWETFV